MEFVKRILLSAVLAVMTVTGVTATVWTPVNIPIVHLQDRERYVCNPDGILSQEAVSSIDAIFRAIEDSTGIQTLIVAVGSIEPADCFEFTHQLGERNGIGQSEHDNGLVIMLSTEERCIQFATGYGIEGMLPDAICKRIQEQYMNPFFKDDNWDDGMLAGAQAIRGYLFNDGFLDDSDDGMNGLELFLSLLPFGVFAALIIMLGRRKLRCPNCHKCKLKAVRSVTILNTATKRVRAITFECKNCHHTLTRNETIYKSYGSSGGGFGGGMSSGGTGGRIGGSYGGGHFGGGGAGSRF